MKLYLPFFVFLFVTGSAFAEAQRTIKLKHKNDVIVMENGDRNTGEIKKMELCTGATAGNSKRWTN